ncbi:MAG TPA: LLM class flavin-dependent oxidoreductase [Candidatus Acidoferrales bacterium]|nr:LLM class flavin-dependent oxidoreductase [Candidatus Acidoferrales bacterium]
MIYDVEFNSAAHYPAGGVIELAERAEGAGFGAYWKGESNSTDPLVLLSGAATRTKTIRLGTAIYHIYGRSAVTLGIQAATLQDLSGGRLLLGLGVANKSIAAWHGGVFDRPLRRAREYIEIVRKTAAGERVEYEGEIYQTGKRFQLSWKPSHPSFPVYLAGLGPQMTKLAGKISDGVFINMATPAKIREIAARVREGAREAGRDPSRLEIIAKCRVSLNPDRKLARSRLRQVLTFYNIADHYSDMLRGLGFEAEVNAIQEAFRKGGFKAAMGALSDEYMDKLPVIPGTSIEEIKEKLLPFAEAGATRLVIPYVPVADPVVDDAKNFLAAWEKAA